MSTPYGLFSTVNHYDMGTQPFVNLFFGQKMVVSVDMINNFARMKFTHYRKQPLALQFNSINEWLCDHKSRDNQYMRFTSTNVYIVGKSISLMTKKKKQHAHNHLALQ